MKKPKPPSLKLKSIFSDNRIDRIKPIKTDRGDFRIKDNRKGDSD